MVLSGLVADLAMEEMGMGERTPAGASTMTGDAIRREETQRRRGAAYRQSRLLRSQPGKWARLKVYDRQNSARARAAEIRSGSVAAFSPKGAYEAAVRRINSVEFMLFVRYVGDHPMNADGIEKPDGFVFVENLPSPGSAVTEREYRPTAERLRRRPSDSEIIQTGLTLRQAQRLASRVRTGALPAFSPAGEFEATHIPDGQGHYAVRVRSTRLVIPPVPEGASAERARGWLEGIDWYQSHSFAPRADLQKEVDMRAMMAE